MKLEEAKKQFIREFGTFGSKWGVNRTMAMVHALLMVSPDPLCADDVMNELEISRGNANMNLRELINWGLVRKTHKKGVRKEFFYAEKDIWKATCQIVKERKRRELDPLKAMLTELSNNKVQCQTPEAESFNNIITEMQQFANVADTIFEKLVESDQKWILNSFLKVIGTNNVKSDS